jgi:hypothetical protein
MPIRPILLTCVLLGLGAAPASATIVPGKGMAGVELGDCQARAIEVLGPPAKTFGRTDFAGFVSTYTYTRRGLKLEFRRGPGECLELTSILTTKGKERTKEGIGQGSHRRTLRRKLRGEKCETFRLPNRRLRSCRLGAFRPGRPVTDFRISSKLRVTTVRVAIVID